jgi:hypothetical protein
MRAGALLIDDQGCAPAIRRRAGHDQPGKPRAHDGDVALMCLDAHPGPHAKPGARVNGAAGDAQAMDRMQAGFLRSAWGRVARADAVQTSR